MEIPKQKTTIQIIDSTIEADQKEEHRAHLGGSLIGHSCMRHIWYKFRWYKKEKFSGRMLRLFKRGHDEENFFGDILKVAGVKLFHVKPNPQKRFFMIGGHFSCELDGIAENVPEAPKTPHVLEFKTYNQKSFLSLIGETETNYKKLRDTVSFQACTEANKPRHWAQMQVGMGMSGLTRALYLAVNKNDDCLAQERVRFDKDAFERLVQKAETVIFTTVKPPRISDRPSWHECRMCEFHGICHGNEQPEKNCRTCRYSHAKEDGTWFCVIRGTTLAEEHQRKEHECYAPA